MARGTVSGQQASNKRAAIVAAAVRSFAARGVARTSMRRVARDVGITDATLYHYFPSKDALLEAAFRSATFQTDDLEAALESTEGALRERLRAVARAFLDVLTWDTAWTRLVVRESLRVPEDSGEAAIGTLVGALGRQRIDALAAAIRGEVARGRARKCDEQLVAAHFFHACVGFWISEALIADAEPTPERREAYVDHLVDLIATRLSPLADAAGGAP
jgi:AcrR family transcriptional regulator